MIASVQTTVQCAYCERTMQTHLSVEIDEAGVMRAVAIGTLMTLGSGWRVGFETKDRQRRFFACAHHADLAKAGSAPTSRLNRYLFAPASGLSHFGGLKRREK